MDKKWYEWKQWDTALQTTALVQQERNVPLTSLVALGNMENWIDSRDVYSEALTDLADWLGSRRRRGGFHDGAWLSGLKNWVRGIQRIWFLIQFQTSLQGSGMAMREHLGLQRLTYLVWEPGLWQWWHPLAWLLVMHTYVGQPWDLACPLLPSQAAPDDSRRQGL